MQNNRRLLNVAACKFAADRHDLFQKSLVRLIWALDHAALCRALVYSLVLYLAEVLDGHRPAQAVYAVVSQQQHKHVKPTWKGVAHTFDIQNRRCLVDVAACKLAADRRNLL